MVIRYLVALALSTALIAIAFAGEGDELTARSRQRSVVKQPAEIGSGVEAAAPIGGESPLKAAFLKSKTASSIEDYTDILALCDVGLDGEEDNAVRRYGQQLRAWAANRRGEAHSQEAARLAADGKPAEAAKCDELALEDFDTAVAADPTKWKALHNRGVSYALAARYEEALNDLTKAIELNGTYVNTWFNRAEVRYELGQYADATEDYTEVIERQPDDFGAYTGRGHAWFRMGELSKALADYNRSVEIDATSAGALVNRGDTYRLLGQWAKAAADYRAAIKVDDGYGRGYRAAAWLMATCPDEKFRNSKLALQAAEAAIEIDGAEDYLYHDTLAAALATTGKYSEAVTAAEEALAIAPDEAKLGIEERLTLYRAGKPYRLSTHVATRPTPAIR